MPFGVIVASFLWPFRTEGCSCVPTSLDEQFADHEFVFVGRVIAAKQVANPEGDPRIEAVTPAWIDISVVVVRTLKGNAEDLPELRVVAGCSFYITIGERYLFFVNPGEDIGPCSGSGNLGDATRAGQERREWLKHQNPLEVPNISLERTVRDKVPKVMPYQPAAQLRR